MFVNLDRELFKIKTIYLTNTYQTPTKLQAHRLAVGINAQSLEPCLLADLHSRRAYILGCPFIF